MYGVRTLHIHTMMIDDCDIKTQLNGVIVKANIIIRSSELSQNVSLKSRCICLEAELHESV